MQVQNATFMKHISRFIILVSGFFTLGGALIVPIHAQLQVGEFSGNNIDSYNCTQADGTVKSYREAFEEAGEDLDPENPPKAPNGRFLCPDGNEAVLRPPALQQIEVWFVRIVYVIWALVASFSFFFLVALAYQWLISRGDVTKITEIRQKIIYYFIGLALVFLAVPILTTVFRLLGINRDVKCYDVAMPGFQFFFTDLCTDPRGVQTDPCDLNDIIADAIRGTTGESKYACPVRGEIKNCSITTTEDSDGDGQPDSIEIPFLGFCCTTNGDQVWTSYIGILPQSCR